MGKVNPDVEQYRIERERTIEEAMQGVSPPQFIEWRAPRPGNGNPSCMNNPYWEAAIRLGASGYALNNFFHGPSGMDAGPCWCFDRYGQSSTQLPDGREVLIGGEHEDYYDPDFYIYNDVVVKHPDGAVDIYGYPIDAFPPTDSHTATLQGNRIILIGSLGYSAQRQPGRTQVLVLDLADFSVRPVECGGQAPGWLYKHSATLLEEERAIRVSGGEVYRGANKATLENFHDWTLDLDTWQWRLSQHRPWQAWSLRRADGKFNHLWHMRQAIWWRGWKEPWFQADHARHLQRLEEALGRVPDLDLVPQLYHPPLPHEALPENEEEHDVHRITVEGVVVRYVEDSYSICMVAEGVLPQVVITALLDDLLAKLQKLEGVPWKIED